ncbi:MAG: hypothetical protein ACLGIG_08530 [Actinomycetes bacterium]
MTANTISHPHLRPGTVISAGALAAVAALVAVVALWLSSRSDVTSPVPVPAVQVDAPGTTGVSNSDRPGSPDALDRPLVGPVDAYPDEPGRLGSPDALDRRR